jgi:hypothetical protein
MKRRRLITLRSDFLSILARHEIGMREMTRLAGIGHATIHQILHPETDSRRTGGMQEKTAWKIVNAFSKKTGIDADRAWELLITEQELDAASAPHEGDEANEGKDPPDATL